MFNYEHVGAARCYVVKFIIIIYLFINLIDLI